ncbi:hypothetical protein HAX54_012859 [Datura stramonium]|uniref:Uncharacterized protein n=1 Tax=Datura stramonium TaxID=4076 RepID=A0ABS8TM37_DATST|nr:hypothetical protein [Datura stramonium]
MPSKNDNEVPLTEQFSLLSIMESIHINVGDIITIKIRDQAQQAYTPFPILVLVMNLCRNAGIPEIERIEENIWANQIVDITKIQDEINPKLKKRKRAPVVAHAFETDMGIDSQVVNMAAQNNTRSTLLIEHMPDMIKRVIDKALAPIHIKI